MNHTFLKIVMTVLLLHSCIGNGIHAQIKDDTVKKIEATYPVIDKMFSDYAKQNHFPGLVYGLVVNGKLIHTGNFGYLNTSQKNTANSKSEFRIASMTKSFTAMAIVKLRDEGKLKLDDPISLYIPEMAAQKYLTTDASPITIRHLLTHAAGFPEDNPWGDRQMAKTDEEFIAMIKKGISFSNDPGLKYEYSNMGYAMLGYIIKKVSGLSYQTYITKNILEPLGMMHTYFEYSKVPPNELAHGYRWLNDQWVEQPMLHDGTYGAMGGMITSIEDFGKYTALHLSAWPPRNDTDNGPIKRSSIREMQFPSNMGSFDPQNTYPYDRICPTVGAYCYGLGWRKYCNNNVYVGHSGGLPGFGSNWKIMPDYGIGIISFSNLTYANMNLINLKVLDTVISLAKLKPHQLPVSAILNQRKNELISLLPEWKNPEAKHIFAENFFMDYFPDSLRKEATTLFNKAGKIIKTGELIPENNLRGSFILEGENIDIEISFTLTPENPPLIQEYNIKEIKKSKK
ncbi:MULTISPECIES: serine hydrolase domain-containing protein [Flavobacterium]|uniref:serine hydrolase domain-containing protein n=1 Tax=Flavobacterium TaxID=237 RepID=UPI001FCC0528|nr:MULTISPECIES: serine hydrolase domain-containing protein [Flavobacterium]UOK43646.1 beta-lactamase family protein [Flavobacterium enshiense]